MTASQAIKDLIAPLLPGWSIQFGRWSDEGASAKYVVIKPAGGMPADLLRRPSLTLSVIGSKTDSLPSIEVSANQIVEAMRSSSGSIVFMQPSEPAYMATSDGRPVFEIAVSAITS